MEMEVTILQDLSNFVEQVHLATKEAVTNTDLDMREFLGIDKALRRFKSAVVNNLAKVLELDKQLDCNWRKQEEI